MDKKTIKILHTSDWHLGNSLYNAKRDQEFSVFLNWMLKTIEDNHIDVLLIAGDVFDNANPSNAVRSQYYDFLRRLMNTSCQHVVITAGNHDSPSFLNAPANILKLINVHTVAYAGSTMDGENGVNHEVLVLNDQKNTPFLIVAAVPFLADRVLRSMVFGESLSERETKVRSAIHEHYDAVARIATKYKETFNKNIPIIAMGHLYVAGGQLGDGVRDLYVGGMGQVSANVFSDTFDYVALGHLHVPQIVGQKEHIRYCGSPLPMGFNEAKQTKQVCLVTFEGNQRKIQTLAVPVFQRLERIKGDWPTLISHLHQLKTEQESIWLEVTYTGERIADLAQRLQQEIKGTLLRILRIHHENTMMTALGRLSENETLEHLSPQMVFDRLMDKKAVSPDKRPRLRELFSEIVMKIQQDPEDF